MVLSQPAFWGVMGRVVLQSSLQGVPLVRGFFQLFAVGFPVEIAVASAGVEGCSSR